MTKKKYQTIDLNGRSMTFNFPMFQEQFLYMANKEGKKIQEYEKHLASLVFVDSSTVHNWRQKRNCPGTLEIIQTIADYWRIPVERLLQEAEPEDTAEPTAPSAAPSTAIPANADKPVTNPTNPNTPENPVTEMKEEVAHMNTQRKFTNREKDAVLRIYDHFLNYIEAYKTTQGFIPDMDLPEDEFGPMDDAYTNMREELMASLKHAVYREYIDLKDTVYDDLKFLVDNGVDTLIYSELAESGEIDTDCHIVTIDPELSEEEQEEMMAQMKEDDESFFLAIYVGTMNYFQSIIDPYL